MPIPKLREPSEREPLARAACPSQEHARAAENPSEFCPVCNRRLASRSCKLVCACGYCMSCSDYY